MHALSLEVTYRKGKPFAAYLYLGRKPGREHNLSWQQRRGGGACGMGESGRRGFVFLAV